jgi:isopenicillin N synthase-like dioxygenase
MHYCAPALIIKISKQQTLQQVKTMSGMMTARGRLALLDIRCYYDRPKEFVEDLRSACHNVGFFLLRHDFPTGLADAQLKEARSFFQLPHENKMEISYEDQPSFRGFMQIGTEQTSGRVDLREQIEYAAEYNHTKNTPGTDIPQYATNTTRAWPPYQRLRARNPWPDQSQPSLKPTTQEYTKHVCRIADSLREALCLAIGLDKHALHSLFQEPHWALKMACYPPTQVSPVDESNSIENQIMMEPSLGVGAHTDSNFLTLVLQDDVGGLQVFSKEEWLDVTTEFGSNVLVCNLGEQAEILSGSYFRATPHRVLANTTQKERISVPIFYNPSLPASIQPIETMQNLQWERPKDKHWRMTSNAMLTCVGDNTFKSLARSHPLVFQKNHDDLQLLPDGRVVRKEECA